MQWHRIDQRTVAIKDKAFDKSRDFDFLSRIFKQKDFPRDTSFLPAD